MKTFTKYLLTLLLLGIASVVNAATEYEIDKKFTSIAELNGQPFAIVNETDGKAIYNVSNQNLDNASYTEAVAGTAYLWKLHSLAEEGVDALENAYVIEAVKADGSSLNVYGQSPIYLNSGAEGGFDGCFVLGNGTQYGTDVLYGGAWEIEYDADKGYALKNVARGGYFAGVNPAPTGTEPIYWTFCTLKEGADIPDPEPVVIPEPEAPLGEGELIPDFFSICADGGIPYGYAVKFGSEDRVYPATFGGGARMFAFAEGGDFTRGIYFREGYVQYGDTKKLTLEAGKKYIVYFNSAMWKSSGATLDFSIFKEGDLENAVLTQTINNTPDVNGSKDAVTGSTRSEIEFTPDADGNYILKWNAEGWREIILANVGMKVEKATSEPVEPAVPHIADGTYYIYNIGINKYLAAGSNWGTHAVVNETGLDYVVTATDGKYTLDSQVSNGGNNHFLNGEWNDGAAFGWILAAVEGKEGVYTISNGTQFLTAQENGEVLLKDDAAADSAQWTLKTLEARIAELATATAEAPVNATFLIADANFGRNDLRRSAWTMEASNQNLSGGNNTNNNAESYHSLFTLSQTLTNAPAGKYQMTAQGFYRQDGSDNENLPVFYANDKTATFPLKTGSENSMTDASASFTAGQYTIEPIEVTVFEDGQLTVGAKLVTNTTLWCIWDNFQLMYYGNQIDLTEVVKDYLASLNNAQSLLQDEAYVNVTGMERNELAEIVRVYGNVDQNNQDALIQATSELGRVSMTFTSVAIAYDAFVAAKSNIDLAAYPYASEDIRQELNNLLLSEAESAEAANYLTEELTTLYRMYVYSNSLLQALPDTEDMTGIIYNPMADEYTDGWYTVLGEDSNGAITTLSDERPNCGYNEIINYFDGGNWSKDSWDVSFQQEITLPKGKYMLSVMSRASEQLVSFRLFAGENSTEMIHIGAQNGIYGNGWNDVSMIFELSEDTTLPIGVQGVTYYLHNWMSFTNFRLMKFPSEQSESKIVDMTAYILNAGFDSDLTWNADGSKKAIIDESVVLSQRSIAAIAADSTVYAIVHPNNPKTRPDGRTFEATNGFKGRIKGWTLETNNEFPNCEWTYFGSLPYALENEAIPIADDGNTYITVPEKPEAANGEDNVGFVYMRAGWGGKAIYKQTVKLPCAQYRLEYWSINLNPNGYNGRNLSKITCRNDVWNDETGFSSNEWTKHEIEFMPTAEFTMEFGFESSGGSGSNPFLCIDGIKLYKIGEADQQILEKQDLEVLIAELENQLAKVSNAGLDGVSAEINDVYQTAQNAYDNDNLSAEEMEEVLRMCRTILEQSTMALAQVNSISTLTDRMWRVVETTDYPGKQELEQSIDYMNETLWNGSAEEILTLYKFGQDALKTYYHSQQPTVDAPADYTYLITHPWFIDENAEPVADGEGGYYFPNGDSYVEGGSNDVNTDLTMQGWVWWRHGYGGYDMRTNWAQGRSCFNAWLNTAQSYRASIVQDLTNIPEGYYTLSADMITQEGCVTNQHVFATYTSYNLDAYAPSFDSPSLTKAGWSDEGNSEWTTLTTPVFYVGSDGLLTIGARGNHPESEDGISSSAGWFLVTNFHLNYYGLENPELNVEVADMLYIAEDTRLGRGKVDYLPVSLKNEEEIVGVQFDVVLPEGMSIAVTNKGKNDVKLNGDRVDDHTVSSNILTDGTIRLVVTSLSNEPIYDNDGMLLNIGVNIPSDMPMGDYTVGLTNVVLTNGQNKSVRCADRYFVVSVGGKMGDVNHDDAIDVTDAVLIIDHILMKNPDNFDESVADVNVDGDIDVTDVVTVIDAILGKIELSRTVNFEEVADKSAYTAFQMDFTIPTGYVLESVTLTDIAKKSHTLAYNMLADGRCRVVVCSMNNEALPGAWDEVIRLNLRGQGESHVNIDRAVFVTIDGERHELMVNPTSIAQISNLQTQTSNLYDLQGRKVEKFSKGILIENGRKTLKK